MTDRDASPENSIAFQGVPGAYSHMACLEALPDMTPVPCRTFRDAFDAVTAGRVRLAMIPIDNSVAGRVADIHHLLPGSGLYITGEHFQRVNHQLLAVHGATVDGLTHVHSHIHALNQCRDLIAELGVEPVEHVDTAGAAREIAERGDATQGAIASRLAAETYGLDILRSGIEDAEHNTTRFVVMAREPVEVAIPEDGGGVVTSFVFQVRNVPAALYKALGGFATNGVNMTKLESYLADGKFYAARFYAEVEGHPAQRSMQLAFEELDFFTHEVRVLGTYPAHPYRKHVNAAAET